MTTHAHMSDGDPLCHSIALDFTHSPMSWSTVQLPLSLYPSFYSSSIFVSNRIFAYLPSYSHIFVTEFREMWSPRQVIHIGSQCSALTRCHRLLLFCFPLTLSVSNFTINTAACIYPYVLCMFCMSESELTFERENMMGRKIPWNICRWAWCD